MAALVGLAFPRQMGVFREHVGHTLPVLLGQDDAYMSKFNTYKNQMFHACENMDPPVANDSSPEIGAIYDGIQKAADDTGVDHRFILAIMLQEACGCVRVKTTNYGVRNPGLMQDHNGEATCNENGNIQSPCPSATIYEMIGEGTAGTNSGDALANCINKSGRGDVSAFYRAARIYNSGSISDTGKLEDNIAIHCYASDIANRLTGWVNAASKCKRDDNPSSYGIVNHKWLVGEKLPIYTICKGVTLATSVTVSCFSFKATGYNVSVASEAGKKAERAIQCVQAHAIA